MTDSNPNDFLFRSDPMLIFLFKGLDGLAQGPGVRQPKKTEGIMAYNKLGHSLESSLIPFHAPLRKNRGVLSMCARV